jgi:hypothetical protein
MARLLYPAWCVLPIEAKRTENAAEAPQAPDKHLEFDKDSQRGRTKGLFDSKIERNEASRWEIELHGLATKVESHSRPLMGEGQHYRQSLLFSSLIHD